MEAFLQPSRTIELLHRGWAPAIWNYLCKGMSFYSFRCACGSRMAPGRAGPCARYALNCPSGSPMMPDNFGRHIAWRAAAAAMMPYAAPLWAASYSKSFDWRARAAAKVFPGDPVLGSGWAKGPSLQKNVCRKTRVVRKPRSLAKFARTGDAHSPSLRGLATLTRRDCAYWRRSSAELAQT